MVMRVNMGKQLQGVRPMFGMPKKPAGAKAPAKPAKTKGAPKPPRIKGAARPPRVK